jgi:hypothetical protein
MIGFPCADGEARKALPDVGASIGTPRVGQDHYDYFYVAISIV